MTRQTFVINNSNNHYYPPSTAESTELPDLAPGNFSSVWVRIWNYIKTLAFLFAVVIVWAILGLTVKCPFPCDLATSLINYAFSGFLRAVGNSVKGLQESSPPIWQEVKRQNEKLQSYELTSPPEDSKEEAGRLNELDSKYWLLIIVIELLSEGNKNLESNLQLFQAIEELEEKRYSVLERLKPLKKKYYPKLKKIQELSLPKSKIEQIEKFLTTLIIKYTASTPPSEAAIEELLKAVNRKSKKHPRNKVVNKLQKIIIWMSLKIAKSDSVNEPIYQLPSKKLIGDLTKGKYHFEKCEHWKALMFDFIFNNDESQDIRLFTNHQEARITYQKEPCDDCKKKYKKRILEKAIEWD
ncbi:hypothetical protein [Microcoleus sp. FACHB-672]|uniref:hypothetical protein n=1 Tax=Microcoleus sp. FACHB-672 TaxID=2692825 RepID=UPI001689A701|nr:hypothetical protein [Microcoleus sp. FACHB-672]MBD2041313.1 hypothetical protein [Microcoleus sp. FACHB-672]